MTPLENAKQRLPLPALMDQLGLGNHAKKSARCPFHEDRNKSFSVFQRAGEWAWNCFGGCGGGDEPAFIAKLEGIENDAACRRFIEIAGVRGDSGRIASAAYAPRMEKKKSESHATRIAPVPVEVSDAWREGVDYVQSHPDAAARLAAFRGWPEEFAQYLIDWGGISLPLYRNERGIAFQVVAPEGQRGSMTTRPIGYHIRVKGETGEKSSWRFFPNEQAHGHGIPALPYFLGDFEQAALLVITEGQWDALTFALAAEWLGDGCLWPKGVGLIGIRGVSGINPFLQHYRKFWPVNVNCLLLPDGDGPGDRWFEGTDTFADRLAELCRKVAVVRCGAGERFQRLVPGQQDHC